MLKHHIILFLRNIKKHKSIFLINILGLSTGLASFVLIALWVNDEVKMDKFHEQDSQLYQVMQNFVTPEKTFTWDITPIILGAAMQEELPEVEMAATGSSREERPEGLISFADKNIKASGMYVSENYFDVLSFPVLAGNKNDFLKNKNHIALSQNLAERLFGNYEKSIGQSVSWGDGNDKRNFVVSGVFDNKEKRSTIKFDIAWNIELLMEMDEPSRYWNGDYAETYLVLKEGTNVNQFNAKISKFIQGKDKQVEDFTQFVQQFSSRYLHGQYQNGELVGGRIEYVRSFSFIALIILLIACINFMNLATAQTSSRMKEIGMKKTIGAGRWALVIQFLSESTLMVFTSLSVALVLVLLLLPEFNSITGKSLELNPGISSILGLAGIAIITGLISGSYPAFYLSSLQPKRALNGLKQHLKGEQWIRKGMVVFQFSLSIIFIIGVFVANQQMNFIQTKNLGFNRHEVLTFTQPNNVNDPFSLITELEKIPEVSMASNMSYNIIEGTVNQSGYSWRGRDEDTEYLFKSPIIGYDVIETLEMKMIQGRSFSRDFNDSDGTKIIINESALKLMQLENPIGKRIGYGPREREIIGVVSDFQYGSMYEKVEPLIFRYARRGADILVRLESGMEQSSIAQIERVFKTFYPEFDFDYRFLDDQFQVLYKSESNIAVLSKYFSLLAIIISCLGLFGLATYTAENRRKEIGIRKVLGQSVINIMIMLSSEFAKLVFLSILIAIPLAYYLTNKWLSEFAYSIALQPWHFLGAATIALLVALITVSFQAIKAAIVNPINSLRAE